MEASSAREFEDREAAGSRRSRVMWVVASTLGMALLGLLALGTLRGPSARMRQYGVEVDKQSYKPQLAEKMPHPHKGACHGHDRLPPTSLRKRSDTDDSCLYH